MGVTPDDLPTLRAIQPGEMKKFKSENKVEDLTVENIGTFVDGVNDGSIEPFMKSEPVEVNDGPLFKIVGKNYEEIVKDETKDVLVKYYAPWCGHC